jgi:ligand-binding sensor domain-containing protein/signal transduction histidine kinase
VRGLDPSKDLTQYGLDAWTTDEGLPNATVNAILQSRDGYLWLGTYDGLARFDGIRFTVYNTSNTPGLGSNGIRALCEEPDGSLWIGTNGGGLSRLHNGRFTRYTVADGLPSDIVWALNADAGGVWVGTNGGGLARFQGGQFQRFPVEDTGSAISSIARDADGNLWLGSQRDGVRRLGTDGHWTTFHAAPGLSGTIATALSVSRDGTLFVGTAGEGLARLEGNHFVPLAEAPAALRASNISALLQDREGTLWIGTNGSGLARYRDGTITRMTAAEGLPENVVYAFLEDGEGSLWFGTNGGGLGRFRDGSFTAFTAREGLSRDFAYVTFQDRNGTLWAGTPGGLDRLEGRHWTHVPLETGANPAAVRSIAEDREGALWVGTYGAGVFCRRGGRWTAYTRRNGLAHDNVRAVLADREGRIWVATIGGLSVHERGAWRTYRTEDGLPKDSLIGLLEDRAGHIWVGTDGGGLCRLRDGHFDVFTVREGLASNLVLALYEDEDGIVWVGTNGGLSRFGAGRFDAFTAADGLPSDAVTQILDDGRGQLWVGTSRGVSRLSKASLAGARRAHERLEVVTFGRADGLKSSQCTAPGQPAGMRSRDGRLWFATTRGVVVVDPAQLRRDNQPPPVSIEEVLIDGRSTAPVAPVIAPPGTGRIQLRYSGLCLLAPGRVSFRFRLQGFDPGWVEARDRRLAEYTSLPPGDYVFQVVAANADGVWNEIGTALPLVVKPRLYQTRWFAFTVALLVLGGAWGGHRLRVSRLERRERELTLLVEERTHKLAEEKERAQRAGHEAEEANAFKTELLGIAAHDLKNPLAAVMGQSEMLSSGLVPAERVADQAEAIYRASEHMLRMVDALLTTAALERGSLELSRRSVDLGRLATAVVEERKAHAERKRQRISVDAPERVVASADEDRLRQVIENLVSNAIKFSPRGATITVAVGRGDHVARLEVRDQGPGLSADDQRRLFQVFARLSARPTGEESSTGLGLSIVKRLVELHGGRVWAESPQAGAGSTFVVELPSSPGDDASRQPSATSS